MKRLVVQLRGQQAEAAKLDAAIAANLKELDMGGSSLGENAEIVMGQSPPGETCNMAGVGLPLLNGPTEYGSHHPEPLQYTTDTRKRAKPGDILFCVRGSTTGRMNWADREYAIGRGVAAIRHKRKSELQPLVRAVIEYWSAGPLDAGDWVDFPKRIGRSACKAMVAAARRVSNNAPLRISSARWTTRLT